MTVSPLINGCLLKVLEGELEEFLYNKNLKLRTKSKIKKNTINYMNNNIGYHRITNNNNINAFSLHIYSPPNHKTIYFN